MIHRRRFMALPLGLAAAGAGLLAACGGGDDLLELTLADALMLLRQERFSAEQLTARYAEQIARYEPRYNAFTTLRLDEALARAWSIDRERRQGRPLGPLAGIPVVVKETMDWVGTPSTMGWTRLDPTAGRVLLQPSANAAVVQGLLDAGAIVLGKTNVPAFSDDGTRANSSWAGPTLNAVAPALAPGASSSGTATAVAAGFATFGVGEETGGSIQNPAAAQSLVGVKPTFGLLSTEGVLPLAGSTRDVVGPIARCVTDAAIALQVMLAAQRGRPAAAPGPVAALSPHALRGKRLGTYGPGWKALPLASETDALYERELQVLRTRGAQLVADPFEGSGFAALALPGEPYDYRGTESVAYDFVRYLKGLGIGSLEAFRSIVGATPFDPGEPLRWYVDALPQLQQSVLQPELPPDLAAFMALRSRYLAVFNDVMDRQRLDALVFPHATQGLPPLLGTEAISETTVSAINIAGLPVVTVPGGEYAGGKGPFSLVFVGRAWSEAALLDMAYDYEQATRHRIVPVLQPA